MQIEKKIQRIQILTFSNFISIQNIILIYFTLAICKSNIKHYHQNVSAGSLLYIIKPSTITPKISPQKVNNITIYSFLFSFIQYTKSLLHFTLISIVSREREWEKTVNTCVCTTEKLMTIHLPSSFDTFVCKDVYFHIQKGIFFTYLTLIHLMKWNLCITFNEKSLLLFVNNRDLPYLFVHLT